MRDQFKELEDGTCGCGDDGIPGLACGDAAPPAFQCNCRNCLRKIRRVDPTSAKPQAKTVVIKMPRTASAAAETVDVTGLSTRSGLLLSLQSLPWLLEYLRAEIQERPAVGQSSDDVWKTSSTPSIYWDQYNICWIARKRTASGVVVLTLQFPVRKRMRTVGDALHGLTFEEAKQYAWQELKEFVDSWHG